MFSMAAFLISVLSLAHTCMGIHGSMSASTPPTIEAAPTSASFQDWVTVKWSLNSYYSSQLDTNGISKKLESVYEDRVYWTSEKHKGELEVNSKPWLVSGCWVGLYPSDANFTAIPIISGSTADQPLTATAPWRHITCDMGRIGDDNTTSFNFSMDARIRQDLVFALFDGGYDTPILLATSKVVKVTDKAGPMQVHIARQQDPTLLSVQWISAFNDDSQQVKWGSETGVYTQSVISNASTFTADMFCGAPAQTQGWADPGYAHEAMITGLKPGSKYYYMVGDDVHGYSQEFSFKGPQLADPHSSTFAIVCADMGETYDDLSLYHWEERDARNTVAHMREFVSADVLLHAGDIAYSTGYQSEWDKFMTAIEPIGAQIPYMTGKGNHEQDWHHPPPGQPATHYAGADSGGECGIATDHRFHMPVQGSSNAGHSNVTPAHGYYSFDQGPVHFIMLNTEMPSNTTDDMYQWFESDLMGVDRKVSPWLVVLGHRMMWDADGGDTYLHGMEPLLLKYKVDLALWGHVHYAEVTCPMYQGVCQNTTDEAGYDAPIHVVIGNGGQTLSPFPKTLPAYDVFHMHEWGFSTLEAHNATDLTMKLYGDGSLNTSAPLRYTLQLNRKYPRA